MIYKEWMSKRCYELSDSYLLLWKDSLESICCGINYWRHALWYSIKTRIKTSLSFIIEKDKSWKKYTKRSIKNIVNEVQFSAEMNVCLNFYTVWIYKLTILFCNSLDDSILGTIQSLQLKHQQLWYRSFPTSTIFKICW